MLQCLINHFDEILTNTNLKRQYVAHYVAPICRCNCIFWVIQGGFSSILLDHHRLNHTKVVTKFAIAFAITFNTHLSPNILTYDDTCVMHEWTHMMHTYYVDFKKVAR
jgi:hypothetical protein